MNPLSDAMRGVADHARSLVQLEVQLALSEMRRKVAALGIGIALALLAVLLLGLAVIFGLAAATAGLAQYLSVWASLLVMCGALFLFADAHEAIKYDRNEAAEKDRVSDGAGAELDRSQVKTMRSELLRKPVFGR